MKQVELKYWLSFGILTAILAAAIWIVFSFIIPDAYPAILPAFLATVALLTAAGQILLTATLRKDAKKFSMLYLVYKSAKMFIIIIFMLIFVLVSKKNGISFLGSVFVIYLSFMFFESIALNRAARKQAEK